MIANAGVRSLSSVAQQQIIPGSVADDFGATSSLSTLMAQKDAENFAAFTYANRHQKGEGALTDDQLVIDVYVASGVSDNYFDCRMLSCPNNSVTIKMFHYSKTIHFQTAPQSTQNIYWQ